MRENVVLYNLALMHQALANMISFCHHKRHFSHNWMSFNFSLSKTRAVRESKANAISSAYAGAWLRAVPNLNLDLSMLQHTFIVAIRIWPRQCLGLAQMFVAVSLTLIETICWVVVMTQLVTGIIKFCVT